MTSSALLIHTLQEKLNHIPSAEDPFFARGRLATVLQRHAVALEYFGASECTYEQAIRRIHNDFSLKGTPRENKRATWLYAAQTQTLLKHYHDTCQGRRKIELNNCWVIEERQGIFLRPQIDSIVEFKEINLLTARVYYTHELEDLTVRFEYFLTEEDHQRFQDLVKEITNRNR